MDTGLIVATLMNSLVLGAIYILVALGFVFLFNMLGTFNLAHGAIYMIGAYIGYGLIQGLGFNNWIGLLLSALITAGFGLPLEKYGFRRLKGDFNRVLMLCVAITVILQTVTNIIAGVKTQAIPSFVDGNFQYGAVLISYERIVIFTVGVSLLFVILWFVNRTRLGQQMQAIAQNMEGATLQGINVHRIAAIACAVGCGLAAVAGCLMGAHVNIAPFMGATMLVKVLAVVMVAGVGSIGGIFVAGFALGTLDATLPILFMYGAAPDAAAMVAVVIILLIRPKGLFGHEA